MKVKYSFQILLFFVFSVATFSLGHKILVNNVLKAESTSALKVAYEPIVEVYNLAGERQDDFAPGETAVLRGTGWIQDQFVDVHLHEDPEYDHDHDYHNTVIDANGNWEIQYFIEERHIGVTFNVEVHGLQSEYTATTTFTDGNVKIDTNSGAVSVTYSKYNSSNNCSGTPNTTGSGTVNTTTTNDTYQGVGNNQTIKLTAPSTNSLGQIFQFWSSSNGSASFVTVGGDSKVICVQGTNGNGAIKLEINYNISCTQPTVTTINSCIGGGNVTFTQTGGNTGGTWSVSGGGSITSAGEFTPNAAGCFTATYTTLTGNCTDTKSFVVFPAAPSAPTVNPGCGAIVVTPPTSVTGFNIEYSFNDGVNWGANTPPTADNCDGYKIKTRYALASACGSTAAGAVSSNSACAASPATTRVVDQTAPTADQSAGAGDATLECDDASGLATALAFAPTFSDNCTASVSATMTSDVTTLDPNCANAYLRVRKWTASDGCSNTSFEFVQTITVEDTTPPTGTAPGDISGLECIADVPAADIAAVTDEADNCGGSVTVTVNDTNNGASGCNGSPYVVTRTYTLTDCGGLETELVQTITVEDMTAPTGTAPGDISGLECIADVPAADIAAVTDEADNCGGSVTVTVNDTNNGASGCNGSPYVVTRTYTLTDCGGLETELVQTITVEDMTAPTGTAPSDISGLECIADVPAADIESVTDEADNCGGSVTVTVNDTNNGASGCNGSPYVVTRTYTLTDCGGLETELVQTITVEDMTAPTGTAPGDISGLECIADVPAADIAAVTDEADNCGGSVTVTVNDTNNGASGCNGSPYVVTRTYTLTDCGGLETELVQTITVEDMTAPTGTAPSDISGLECIADVPAADIESVTDEADNCGGSVTVTVNDTNNGASGCNGSPYVVTRTYTLTDCGGLETELVQTITVEDMTAPTGTAPDDISGLECIADVPAADIAAVTDEADNCGGSVTVTVNDTNNGASGCNGSPYVVTRTYTLTDCGGLETELVQTITVEDMTAPTGTAPGDISGLECIADVPAADIAAVTDVADNCGGSVTVTVNDTNNGASGCNGSPYVVTRTYTLTDCGGLETELVQTITVEDMTAPTGTAPGDISGLECIADVPAADIAAVTDVADNCGGSVTVTVNDTNNGASGCNGSPYVVTRTYTLTDCGGLETELVQTITVEDMTAPTGTAPGDISGLECIADVPAADIESVTDEADNCGGSVTVTVNDTNNGASGCNGSPYVVTRTYTLTDCGGLETELVQTITVEDMTAPTGTAPGDISGLECIADVPAADIAAVTDVADNCGGSVTVTVNDTNNGASGCNGSPYVVTRTYTLTDCGGLETELVQTITVEDMTAPTGTAPGDISGLECIADVPAADIESVTDEADNCGGAVTVTVADTNNGGSGCNGDAYIVTRTYTLTDCGGLTTELVQTITVEDTTAPNLSAIQPINPQPINTSFTLQAPSTGDNCSASTVTWYFSSNGTFDNPATVADFTIAGSLSGGYAQGTFTSNDFISVSSPNGTGVYSVKLVVKDACGNESIKTYDFLVIYDPNGGFVTGGGWIYSEPEYLIDNPNAYKGKANFGFVAKYKTGRNNLNEVDGNTNFQFKEGNFHFKSSSHEDMSLVISGLKKATYRGIGTINNGTTKHYFVVTVIDGDAGGDGVDRFRIVIYGPGTTSPSGQPMYDNELSQPLNADATTAIGGGSIVIHKPTGKNKSGARIAPEGEVISDEFKLISWPNPSKDVFNIKLKSPDLSTHVEVNVFDLSNKLVHSVKISANTEYSFGENLDSGIYIVKISQAQNNKSVKLVKY